MSVSPRITDEYRYNTAVEHMRLAREENDQLNEIASSGTRLHKLSTDPVAVVRVMRNKASLQDSDQFKKSIEFGDGYLQKTETALMSVYGILVRAKELAIQQSSTLYDESNRSAVNSEVMQLNNNLVSIGNSTYNDKYIFGGFRTGTPPVMLDGSFLGDDGRIFIQVSPDNFRPINVKGREIFGQTAENLAKGQPSTVGVLLNLSQALQENNFDLLHTTMDDLDKKMQTIMSAVASVGGARSALQNTSSRLEDANIQAVRENEKLDATDMIQAAADMKKSQGVLEYTLKANEKMLSATLMDFLK